MVVKTAHPKMRREARQGARPALLCRHHGVSYYKSAILSTKVLHDLKHETHLLHEKFHASIGMCSNIKQNTHKLLKK